MLWRGSHIWCHVFHSRVFSRPEHMSILCVCIIVAQCFSRAAANGLEDQVRVGVSPGIKTGEPDMLY